MQFSPEELLYRYFGHTEFRTGQREIIDSLINGRDVLCVMPTGAGKSVCYQIPALIKEGITIVISPLISLMKDQVNALTLSGIQAVYINSSMTSSEYMFVRENEENGSYKIIYVAPERLESESFLRLCQWLDVSMVIVDEAHCVSKWGQDFRPSYLQIAEFVKKLDSRPTMGAFTATATNEVSHDIIKRLELKSPLTVKTGFDRPNLKFTVLKPKSKTDTLLSLIEERVDKFGIVYCATRKTVEEVCDMLKKNGINATRYHAGLSDKERKTNQEDFVYDRKNVMVATNAFGMGIDKSNVGFVIHYNMPKDIESYYQEAGRAGRDGEEADCILLYSPKDVITNQFLMEMGEMNPLLTEDEQADLKRREEERLKQMTFYCTTTDCLRRFIMEYFGDSAAIYCGKCSNCLTKFEDVNVTVEAQKILSCIAKTRCRFGKNAIIDTLRGSKSLFIQSRGLYKQSTYGIMADCSKKRLRDIIDCLIDSGYIGLIQDDGFSILGLTELSKAVLLGEKEVTIKLAVEPPPSEKKKKSRRNKKEKYTNETPLFTELRRKRAEIAARENVPAYVVFHDTTLRDMSTKMPQTIDEFMDVSGVGVVKSEKYGDEFIEVIKEYIAQNNTDDM